MAQKFTVPITVKQLASAGSDAVTVYVDQDTFSRLKVEAGGRLTWGSGASAGDVNLYRASADVLQTDDTFKAPILFVDNIEIDPTGATTDQVLKFDGTKFIASTSPSGATSLDGLTDVVITTPEEFQTLEYDGTNWVNTYSSVVSNVRNAEATTLTTGTVVYLFGATGDHATVKRADKASDTTSSKTVGLVGANITASNNGPVITRGYVDGIDLSVGYSPGDVLWLGSNGAFTKTKAVAPDHLVFVGVVVRATNNGIVYVATQNGYELDELHNVSIPSPVSGDFLKYNGTLWVNDAINLGTDTVGNYMSDVSAGTGISVTHTPSEGSTGTVAIDTAVVPRLGVTNTFSTNQIISGSTTADLLRITQTGTGNALRVEDSTNVDSTPFVIDASGNVGIGTGTPASLLHVLGGALGGTAGNELIVSQVRATNANQDIVYTKYRRVTTGADWTTAQAKIQRTIDVTDMGYIAFGGTSTHDVRLGTGTSDLATFATTGTTITTFATTNKVLVVKGAASQTGALFEAQDSAGTALAYITASGNYFTTSGGYHSTGGVVLRAGSTAHVYLDTASGTAAHGEFYFRSSSAFTERMRIDSSGQVGIGATPVAGRTLTITKTMTGATTVFGILNNGVIQSDVTAEASYYRTGSNTAAASFTVPALYHYYAVQGSIGAGSSVTTQAAFVVGAGLTGASNNIGFYGDIPSAAGRWNLYMSGTADNYISGNTGIGGLPVANIKLHVAGPAANTTNPTIRLTGVSGSGTLNFFNDLSAGSYNNITAAGSKGIIAAGANASTTRASFVIAPWSDVSYGIRFEGGATTNILQHGTTIFQPSATTSIASVMRGLASQTANLQEWQNSSSTVLAYVDSSGNAKFASIDGGSA